MEDPNRHPTVVHFSRRAAIKISLVAAHAGGANADTAIKMEPYHADYSRLPVREAQEAMENTVEKIRAVLEETPQEDPDWFTFDSLERTFETGLVSFLYRGIEAAR